MTVVHAGDKLKIQKLNTAWTN